MEFLFVVGVLTVAALAVPRGPLRLGLLAASLASALALAAWQVDRRPDIARYRPADATARPDAEYASSRACRPCHPAAYASWRATYHRKMTQVASPESVLAPFDGRTLTDGARSYRVFRDGDRFFVDQPWPGTTGATAGERLVAPVVMTTGSHHMQAYWLPAPTVDDAPERMGRAVFNRRCTPCHGRDGGGGKAPTLAGAQLDGARIDAVLADTTHAALLDAAEAGPVRHFVDRVQNKGQLMQFPFVWLVEAGRFAHEEDTFVQPPVVRPDVEPFGDAWSDACDQCHSVRPDFAWTPRTQSGAAAVAELGIACEACHGPGRRHIARHRDPIDRYATHLSAEPPDDIVHPGRLDPQRASAVCGQCHGELIVKDAARPFRPGEPLADYADIVHYTPKNPPPWLASALEAEPTMLEDAFWRDGTIRIAGRDYNALAETGCFTRGALSCLSCHQMHGAPANDQLRGPRDDDGICLECHALPDVPAHTHHREGSTGSRCNNCHMPHTTVGLLGLMRAHRIDSPDAGRTAWTGRPNACNLCHLDFTLAQVAERLTAWYGQPPLPEVADDLGASAALAWLLRGDAVQRAAAAWHLGWAPARAASGDGWQAIYLAALLDDPYAVVRFIAARSLRAQPGFGDFEYDYTAAPADRLEAVERAATRWRAGPRPPDRAGLLLEGGEPRWAIIRALRARRDDTEVRVNE
ncbi:MAG: hypothetical protein KC620_09310 [Myxococcales bacterium]|nr:hypothetical protein [Myxococcales bacterium]